MPATDDHSADSLRLNTPNRVKGAAASSSSGSRNPTILTRPPPRLRATSTMESRTELRAFLRRVIEMNVEIIG